MESTMPRMTAKMEIILMKAPISFLMGVSSAATLVTKDAIRPITWKSRPSIQAVLLLDSANRIYPIGYILFIVTDNCKG